MSENSLVDLATIMAAEIGEYLLTGEMLTAMSDTTMAEFKGALLQEAETRNLHLELEHRGREGDVIVRWLPRQTRNTPV